MSHLERQDDILNVLSRDKVLSVHKLSKILYVSEATIRRDLIKMNNLGLIRRTHGGAMIAKNTAQESSFAMREIENLAQKKLLCSLAVRYINDHSVIYLDSSSTTMPIIPLLNRFQHLTVITHGIRTALMLSEMENIEVYIAGGRVGNFSNSILGNSVIEFYDTINADLALISGSGISENGDITDNNMEQAKIKKIIIEKSQKVLLLVDHTKLGKTFMNTTFRLEDVDILITDKVLNEPFNKIAENAKCEVINT
ncbi:MAG: DeoR/GlpR transcriptional regulator [Acholeplasmataceae bacterium]|nr:DeoR/GlpR transcriptional regulator [Acholeplasmataceae bacterium]